MATGKIEMTGNGIGFGGNGMFREGSILEIPKDISEEQADKFKEIGVAEDYLGEDKTPGDDTPSGNDTTSRDDTISEGYTTSEGNAALLHILDNNLKDLAAGIKGFSLEHLQLLRDAENNGKTRKGALEAIGEEIEQRQCEELEALLDKDEKDIIDALPDFSEEDLLYLRNTEEEGHNRENILEAIDNEVKAKDK